MAPHTLDASNAAVCVTATGVIVAAVAARPAYNTYRYNSNTKRAEFLLGLHKSFFVDKTYTDLRNRLDNSNPGALKEIEEMVDEESYELTDFLNFFELIAYFESCETLRRNDVEALLGYYLDLLRKNPTVYKYIRRDDRSFGHLKKLLQDRKLKR